MKVRAENFRTLFVPAVRQIHLEVESNIDETRSMWLAAAMDAALSEPAEEATAFNGSNMTVTPDGPRKCFTNCCETEWANLRSM